MKAVLSKAASRPDHLVLEEMPSPVIGAGQAIVRVKACGVNYRDVLLIEDKYQFKPPRPFSPGSEVAGIVTAISEGLTGIEVGNRVIGAVTYGGMAEELALDAAGLRPIPKGMPFD